MSQNDKIPSDQSSFQATVVGVSIIVVVSIALICFFCCSCTAQVAPPIEIEDLDVGMYVGINHICDSEL